MSEDRVIGVAILDRTETPEELVMRCQKRTGEIFVCAIPVYRKGTEKVYQNQWAYETQLDTLNMTPSVNMPGRPFHNAFSWSVRFQFYDPDKFGSPRIQLEEANKPDTTSALHD